MARLNLAAIQAEQADDDDGRGEKYKTSLRSFRPLADLRTPAVKPRPLGCVSGNKRPQRSLKRVGKDDENVLLKPVGSGMSLGLERKEEARWRRGIGVSPRRGSDSGKEDGVKKKNGGMRVDERGLEPQTIRRTCREVARQLCDDLDEESEDEQSGEWPGSIDRLSKSSSEDDDGTYICHDTQDETDNEDDEEPVAATAAETIGRRGSQQAAGQLYRSRGVTRQAWPR